MAKQQKSLSSEIRGIGTSIKTGVKSITEAVSACGDSNYNQPQPTTTAETKTDAKPKPDRLMMSIGDTLFFLKQKMNRLSWRYLGAMRNFFKQTPNTRH